MNRTSVSLGLVLLALCPLRAAAQWSVSSGFDYSSGSYGLSEKTRMLAMPVTASYTSDRWIIAASLPFLRVSGPAYVVPELGSVGEIRPESTTASGAGDLVLSASYALPVWEAGPGFELTAKVKLGTASEAKGLGSGKNDFHVQADVYHGHGNLMPFGTLGYRVLGDPAGFELRDGFFASAGASYRWSGQTRLGGVLDWRQRAVDGGDDALELTAFVSRRLGGQWRVQVYVVRGFTNASPDTGGGTIIGYSF